MNGSSPTLTDSDLTLTLTFTMSLFLYVGGVAQMVERLLCMQKAQGSIPCSSTFFSFSFFFIKKKNEKQKKKKRTRRDLNPGCWDNSQSRNH